MLSFYSYSLVRFVPNPVRDEAVNLGVLVVSDDERRAVGAFLERFTSRVRAIDPYFNIGLLKDLVQALSTRAAPVFQRPLASDADDLITSSAHLRSLHTAMRNQLQLSEPRTYRAITLDDAAVELYAELVSPTKKAPKRPRGMNRAQLRRLIRRTIRDWGDDPGIKLHEGGLERVRKAQHFADFWFQNGAPLAALIAIPSHPDERSHAWALRDSVPTISEEFRQVYPGFKTVAVFPPSDLEDSPFVLETAQFLGDRTGVVVAYADELAERKYEILPGLLDEPHRRQAPRGT